MTWLDQLHLYLKRLGYEVPPLPMYESPRYFPGAVPVCEDTKYFAYLKTARFMRGGYASWAFAFEGSEGCNAAGFRTIAGHEVSCQLGWQCDPQLTAEQTKPAKLSRIVAQAARSNITLLSTWFNDGDQYWSHYRCFNHKKLGQLEIGDISVAMLLQMIRRIHQANPWVQILVMGKFTPTRPYETPPWLVDLNNKVKLAVEQEPNTFFVDYHMPSQAEGEFYQIGSRVGHPNCRGSKLMALAALRRLWDAKIIGKSLLMAHPVSQFILRKDCEKLTVRGCHTSGFCWLDEQKLQCVPYGHGSHDVHYVWNYGKTGIPEDEKSLNVHAE